LYNGTSVGEATILSEKIVDNKYKLITEEGLVLYIEKHRIQDMREYEIEQRSKWEESRHCPVYDGNGDDEGS